MKSIFHGVDVVCVDEFARVLAVEDKAGSSRVFSQSELDQFKDDQNRLKRLAGRFAAKEAVLKALKTGFGTGISLKEISIGRTEGEPPIVVLEGAALETAKSLGISEWVLSISYGGNIAFASVIAASQKM